MVTFTEQGIQSIAEVFKAMSSIFGNDHIRTTLYRPQSNGILERRYGTLKPILAVTVKVGGDWIDVLQLTLFYLDSYVVGNWACFHMNCRRMRGQLDIVYAGWTLSELKAVCMSKWLSSLLSKLSVL